MDRGANVEVVDRQRQGLGARRWGFVLGAACVIAVAMWFLGASVAPCSKPVGGSVSPACIAAWEARWSLPERLVHIAWTMQVDLLVKSVPRDPQTADADSQR